jgi:MarR family transcriptional regulator, organic hydroperoxide resistance regulator
MRATIPKRSTNAAAKPLTDSLDFLIRDTRLLLTRHISTLVAQHDIPLRAWFPLRVLHRHEGITQRELGAMLGYGDAHAGVIVRSMERRRLVDRRPSKTDKRRIDLYLTPEGKKMAKKTLAHQRTINRRIVAGFSAAEARTLMALLVRAHENLMAT